VCVCVAMECCGKNICDGFVGDIKLSTTEAYRNYLNKAYISGFNNLCIPILAFYGEISLISR
jgi:hypothetical protein